MGIMVTHILKETVLLSKKKNGGGHAIIKIDIEGGEHNKLLGEDPVEDSLQIRRRKHSSVSIAW
jgi:hypothetical protein